MASSPLALPLAFPLSLSLPKAVTLPLPFHLCCHPVADLLPTLFLNCNHLSLPRSPAPQNQPTSCCRITYFVTLIFENYRGWWTKCKALSLNSQRCLGKTQLSILALVHSPPHMYTSPYIAHLRETSRSSPKMIRLPSSYGSFWHPALPLCQLIIISDIQRLLQGSGQVTSSMKTSLIRPQCVIVPFSDLL